MCRGRALRQVTASYGEERQRGIGISDAEIDYLNSPQWLLGRVLPLRLFQQHLRRVRQRATVAGDHPIGLAARAQLQRQATDHAEVFVELRHLARHQRHQSWVLLQQAEHGEGRGGLQRVARELQAGLAEFALQHQTLGADQRMLGVGYQYQLFLVLAQAVVGVRPAADAAAADGQVQTALVDQAEQARAGVFDYLDRQFRLLVA